MLGAGTVASPYLIETVADWEQVRLRYTSHFKLVNDLDFAGATYSPFNFSGVLDGDGHVLRNMVIRGSTSRVGIIGTLSINGNVKNLGVESIDSKPTATNYQIVGSLIGDMIGNSRVENCYVKDSTIGLSNDFVGALIGRVLENSVLLNSYALDCNVIGKNYSSSLVGDMNSAKSIVENCFANSIVIPATGAVLSGGLIANLNKQERIVKSSYFDIEKAPLLPGKYENSYDGIPLTSAQMKQQSSYVGFDFDTVWGFAEYPYLKVFGDLAPPYLSGEESVTSYMNPISSSVKTRTTINRLILVKSHLSTIESKAVSKYIPAPKKSTQSVTANVNEIDANISTKQSRTVNVSSYSDKIEGNIETERIAIVRTIKSVTGSMQPITAQSNSKGKRVMVNYVSSYMRSLQCLSVSSIHRPYKHILATVEVIVGGSDASYEVNNSSVENQPLHDIRLEVESHTSKATVQENPSYTEVIE